jgi:hypothetical protein
MVMLSELEYSYSVPEGNVSGSSSTNANSSAGGSASAGDAGTAVLNPSLIE